MSLFGTPSAYDPNRAAPWAQGIRSIGGALAMRPVYQAQAARLQAQDQLTQARTDTERAQTGEVIEKTRLTKAQADEAEGDNATDLQLAAALKKLTVNPNDTDAQGDAIAGFGRAYKKNPEGTAKAMGQLFAQFQARQGSTNYANMGALQGDAASIANNQANNAQKATAPMHVAPGGVIFDPQTGKPIFTNPSAAAQEGAYETTVTEIPENPGSPAVPAKNHWFRADEPAIPAVPATHAQKITRRVPIGMAAAAQPPTTNAPAAGGKVRVQHPSGSFGYIPAEQLQDALSQGFKLAPK